MSTGDFILRGMPNLHSHAFQRAMAGQAELASKHGDDFWSWRKKMYDYANRLTPEQLQAIAAQLFMEMLKSGLYLGRRVPLPASYRARTVRHSVNGNGGGRYCRG